MKDFDLEQDDESLTYGSAQELRHLVNGILDRVAITMDSPTKDVAHALIDALRLSYSRRHRERKKDKTIERLKEMIDAITGGRHGFN